MACRELIQPLLPTCQRCRRLRRKCDTQLPDCRLCQKAGAECTLFDHALQQSLPRAYVQSLLTRLEHLKAVKDTVSISPRKGQQHTSPVIAQHMSPALVKVSQPSPIDGFPESHTYHSFDKHYPIAAVPDRSRFFGSSSVFALSIEVLHHASTKGIVPSEYDPPSPIHDDIAYDSKQRLSYESYGLPEAVRSHCKVFLSSSNILYGIIDESAYGTDMSTYNTLRSSGFLPPTLHGPEAHAYFRTSMMCAIACATRARYQPVFAIESMAYYHDALPCVEEVTSEVSPASLQALLLLTVFCLFYPKKGDIWKLLDYACRLTVELGYHTETEGDVVEDECQRKLRRSTFWGLYAIERITGQLFGRSSDLPESIITTEYPSVLIPNSDVSQETLQPMSIAHHYRLVYLRSELYKALYLPANPLFYDWSWYKARCATLRDWRKDLDVSEGLEGVATITCDVGYHSTMCFIFQPIMLRALKETGGKDTGLEDIGIDALPQDNYHSAVALLATYEKVIHAPESSPLGIYPMTFLSAHYIYLAGLTLMAHALLALDGRLGILKRMEELEFDEKNDKWIRGEVDWKELWEANNSCLVLLQWCAERWKGMEGMRDIYQGLAGKVGMGMVRNGLI